MPGLVVGLALNAAVAWAQSLPPVPGGLGWYYGFVASAQALNTFAALKQDWIGASPYTVATLPACTTANAFYWAMVTDATSPTYNGSLTGSGTVKVPVWCNGSAWSAH
jgi:hypothetical protein